MKTNFFPQLLFSVLGILAQIMVFAQAPTSYSSTQVQQLLKQLPICGTVLYVAAHPDDENTRLIAYLAHERHLDVHYLSLTRGDGGQNLIGTELSEGLGVIRTQELLAARRIDGGHQLFSMARDFGFSKTPEETYTKWPRRLVLRNVVQTIRRIKPDVIITRFSPLPAPTHGHHTASAQLALEAFTMAVTDSFPGDMDEAKQVRPWQAKRIFWNISSFFFQGREKEFKAEKYLKLDIGGYNPTLGLNYQELAGLSRSQHKSQGFGSATSRGASFEYFELLAGDSAKVDIMDGIDLSWQRLAGTSQQNDRLLDSAYTAYQLGQPEKSIKLLAKALQRGKTDLQKVPGNVQRIKEVKIQQIEEAILAIAGIRAEVTSSKSTFVSGDDPVFNLEVVNRSKVPVTLVGFNGGGHDTTINKPLAENQPWQHKANLRIAYRHTQPFWLEVQPSAGNFNLSPTMSRSMYDQPESNQRNLTFTFRIADQIIKKTVNDQHKSVDPIRGELYQPIEILPYILVKPLSPIQRVVTGKPTTVKVEIEALEDYSNATFCLKFNDGSTTPTLKLEKGLAGSKRILDVTFVPKAGQNSVVAMVQDDDTTYTYRSWVQRIRYDHIPNQLMLKEAKITLVNADIKTKTNRLGYIMGAGDEVPDALRLMGYQVDLLTEANMKAEVLKQYPTIVVGIRAYNTHTWLKKAKPLVLDYVQRGGNYIVQYNTANFLSGADALDSIAPYPIKISSERVTVEESPVSIYLPDHPALSKPNKISNADFDGWVQERGLYFVKDWKGPYQAPLGMKDPNEPERKGGLLIAQYGKGHYVYTGISFFRQLPAGVGGAYRLMANLIELGH